MIRKLAELKDAGRETNTFDVLKFDLWGYPAGRQDWETNTFDVLKFVHLVGNRVPNKRETNTFDVLKWEAQETKTGWEDRETNTFDVLKSNALYQSHYLGIEKPTHLMYWNMH